MDCIFCKIASGEIKADLVYQDDQVAAFRDLKPQAPVHILIVPKQHIPSLAGAGPEHEAVFGRIMAAASRLAEAEGIARSGFRVVMNAGADAGQTVDHVHLHLLGGRGMGWPPG
jgi:histidine triad (HIT) family protein